MRDARVDAKGAILGTAVRTVGTSLLTVEEVAELLRVPVSWVYERTRSRTLSRIPGFRLGKYWRFREEDVLTWIEQQRVGARPNA